MESLDQISSLAIKTFLGLWWLWAPAILGALFSSMWLAWRQFLFKAAIPWALLDVKIPREIKKSPKAMEQILANIWSLRNTAGNLREIWWDGEVTMWFSFEIVSFGGDIHFYIRTPNRYVNIIKANLYAQYTDIEVDEVDDYIDRLPQNIPEVYERGYEMWGAEMKLGNPDAYPIRTYTQYESDEEAKNIDPISGVLEVLSKIDPQEILMIQILARPSTDPNALKKAVDQEVKRIKAELIKAQPKAVTLGEEIGAITSRTPGETELLKQVEMKGFKSAFECMVRYVYFAPREIFNVVLPYRGIRIAFMQFSAPNLNFFTINFRTWTRAWMWDPPHIFPTRVAAGRKERMLFNYRMRALPAETFMGKLAQFYVWSSTFTQKSFLLNLEELATLWHLPTAVVLTQPLIKRVESRKLGPPAGLPIFREERGVPGIMQ